MACAWYPETDGVPEATNRSSRACPCVVSLACGDRVASEAPLRVWCQYREPYPAKPSSAPPNPGKQCRERRHLVSVDRAKWKRCLGEMAFCGWIKGRPRSASGRQLRSIL